MSRLFLHDAVSGKSYTYTDLIADLNKDNDTIHPFVYTSDLYEVFKAYIQALLFGAQVTLLDHDFSVEEINQLLPSGTFPGKQLDQKLDSKICDRDDLISRLRNADDTKIGFFTSGTTGLPKRVDHKLQTLARSVKISDEHKEAIWAFAYNPTHIAGCQVFLQAILNGNSLVNVFGASRQNILNSLSAHRCTHISATPTFYRMLLPAESVVRSMKRVTFGGEKMDTLLAEKLTAIFPEAKFLNVYASTEAGTILAADGEVFRIKPEVADLVKVQENQLYLHSELLGTFGGGQAQVVDWYPTGDIVEIVSAEPLRFKIKHRVNDLINVGGYKVNPAEVEETLSSFPGIKEARVYGKKNSVMGNLVCCDIILSDPAVTERSIRKHLAQELQAFKIPRVINFVNALEKTRTGKLKRS